MIVEVIATTYHEGV